MTWGKNRTLYFMLVIIFSTPLYSYSDEPTLRIQSGNKEIVYRSSDLLNHPDTETIVIGYDVAYQKKMTYKAIRVTKLFEKLELKEDAVIQFNTLDGFSAPLHKQRLLNKSLNKSVAYIAIEPLDGKWLPLREGKPSAGPFYLVWINPELSAISPNEWPYMLTGFEVKGSLRTVFPKIFPDMNLANNHPVQKGFQGFLKNCFPCHTINKNGASQNGPDLNLPLNPTEYFKEAALKTFIRNPQNVRLWPEAKMPGFGQDVISDHELKDLIAYLKHMAKLKKK